MCILPELEAVNTVSNCKFNAELEFVPIIFRMLHKFSKISYS